MEATLSPSDNSCTSRRNLGTRGFALLAVIWILALLVTLAAGLAADTRDGVRLTRNRVALAQVRALAEAGVTLGAYSMLDGALAQQWHADGTVHEVSFGGGRIAIAVQDEGGKVDLNAAPPELIEGLFGVLGIDDGPALVRGITDRRARYGAPDGGPAAPRVVPPGGRGGEVVSDPLRAPFAAVAELNLLPGMTRAIYDRLRPFVTVHSGSAQVNPLTAPRQVLLGLPGVSPQEVGFLIAARDAAAEPSTSLPTLSGVEPYAALSNLRAFTVRARAATGDGATFVREAILVLTGAPLHPIRYVEWRRGAEEEGTPAE